ncbi:hypothetical protein CR513_55692, partial [Mucuna pruriens]
MATAFEKFTFLHVPRELNKRVDLLSKLASTHKRDQQRSIIHENISRLTIEEPGVCCVERKKTWISPLLEYLREDRLLDDPTKANKLVKDVSKYIVIGKQLYRRGFSFPLLRCVDAGEFEYGVCGTHIGGRALASKIAKAGYYWPTLKNDYMEYVKKCDRCQRFTEVLKSPPESLHSITSPWPFYK